MSLSLFLSLIILLRSSTAIIVNTPYGQIEGRQTEFYNKFTKIPFAEPPINELRFKPPQSIEPWDPDILEANGDYIPACPQTCDNDLYCPSVITEDCLYLNIYTPLDASMNYTNYAVLVWIYGGSFLSGFSGGIVYDPTSMLKYVDDIIYVSINYRVGLFGALYDTQYNTSI